jgi:putative SOS response-associated peptidase YedK
MCSTYETGQFTGNVPLALDGDGIGPVASVSDLRLIRRTDLAPVYLKDEGMVSMRWGYERPKLGVINNTRSENLHSPMWRESFEERRCLIPVNAFYEWTGGKGRKRTHRFTGLDGSLLWAAGIWEEADALGRCYSMLTTEANSLVAPIHHRMPSILIGDEQARYMNGGMDVFDPLPQTLVINDAPNPLLKNPPTHSQDDLF